MPNQAEKEWYDTVIPLEMDRFSMLVIVGSIELALRHPQFTGPSAQAAREIGFDFARRLLVDGLDVPDEVVNSWSETFQVDLSYRVFKGYKRARYRVI